MHKKTRTGFTPKDDQIIYSWIHKAREINMALLGKTLYQQMERRVSCSVAYSKQPADDALQYPHHTWQSWMDRWKRTLSKRPARVRVALDDGPDGPVMEYNNGQSSKPRGHAGANAEPGTWHNVQSPRTPSMDSDKKAVTGRRFTADDDAILREEHSRVMEEQTIGLATPAIWGRIELQASCSSAIKPGRF